MVTCVEITPTWIPKTYLLNGKKGPTHAPIKISTQNISCSVTLNNTSHWKGEEHNNKGRNRLNHPNNG